jgi:hypothetical protein
MVDQALLPNARHPSDRLEFYDTVWGVDPFVLSLPESEGLLYQTGYAPLSYPGYYPLLGPAAKRTVLLVDIEATTQCVVTLLRQHGLKYAYVIASADQLATVFETYERSHFSVIHESASPITGVKVTRLLFALKGE